MAEFEREVAGARGVRSSGGRTARRRALEQAVARFRGDFLDGEPAGDWHLEHRDRLQRLFVDALMELGDLHASEDRLREGGRRVPSRARARRSERGRDARADALLRAGRASARRRCGSISASRDRLRKELDAEPEDETQELYEELQRVAELSADRLSAL